MFNDFGHLACYQVLSGQEAPTPRLPRGARCNATREAFQQKCSELNIPPHERLAQILERPAKPGQGRLMLSHAHLTDKDAAAYGYALRTFNEGCGNDESEAIGEVVLSYNPTSDWGICNFIMHSRLCTVAVLELFACGLQNVTCDVIAAVLANNTQLSRLKLGDNNITVDGVRSLVAGLRCNSSLAQLHVGGNPIGDEGVDILCRGLRTSSSMTSISLRDTGMTDAGCQSVAELLQSSSCSLSELQLKGNEIGLRGAAALAGALRVNTSLKVLELQSNHIGALGTSHLADALLTNSTLHCLNLALNDIGDAGVASIAKVMSAECHITSLCLEQNRIQPNGIECLAEALGANTSLTHLDLKGNAVRAQGAAAMARALLVNTTLMGLHLHGCDIPSKGSCDIAHALLRNTTLRNLDVGSNYSMQPGAEAWAEVLAHNSTLTRLCLTDNEIAYEGVEGLLNALTRNRTLRAFSFGGQSMVHPLSNKVTTVVRRKINRIIQENKQEWEVTRSRAATPPPLAEPQSTPGTSPSKPGATSLQTEESISCATLRDCDDFEAAESGEPNLAEALSKISNAVEHYFSECNSDSIPAAPSPPTTQPVAVFPRKTLKVTQVLPPPPDLLELKGCMMPRAPPRRPNGLPFIPPIAPPQRSAAPVNPRTLNVGHLPSLPVKPPHNTRPPQAHLVQSPLGNGANWVSALFPSLHATRGIPQQRQQQQPTLKVPAP